MATLKRLKKIIKHNEKWPSKFTWDLFSFVAIASPMPSPIQPNETENFYGIRQEKVARMEEP